MPPKLMYPRLTAGALTKLQTDRRKQSDILTKSENDVRNNQLKEEGFIFYQGVGISKNEDWSEDSFFIENIDLKKANEISLKYG